MGTFPVIKPNDLIKFLEKKGFYISRSSGSHIQMRKDIPCIVRATIPRHNQPLKRGTLLAIIKQIGLTKEDLQSIRS